MQILHALTDIVPGEKSNDQGSNCSSILSGCDFFWKAGGGKKQESPVLAQLLQLDVVKEGNEQSCPYVSLLGGVCIVFLDTVSSIPSSFLKGIQIIVNYFSKSI